MFKQLDIMIKRDFKIVFFQLFPVAHQELLKFLAAHLKTFLATDLKQKVSQISSKMEIAFFCKFRSTQFEKHCFEECRDDAVKNQLDDIWHKKQ